MPPAPGFVDDSLDVTTSGPEAVGKPVRHQIRQLIHTSRRKTKVHFRLPAVLDSQSQVSRQTRLPDRLRWLGFAGVQVPDSIGDNAIPDFRPGHRSVQGSQLMEESVPGPENENKVGWTRGPKDHSIGSKNLDQSIAESPFVNAQRARLHKR